MYLTLVLYGIIEGRVCYVVVVTTEGIIDASKDQATEDGAHKSWMLCAARQRKSYSMETYSATWTRSHASRQRWG